MSFGQLQTGSDIAVTSTLNPAKSEASSETVFTPIRVFPYAEADRFEAPRKPKAWEGVRSSLTWGPVAPLLTPTTRVMDESEFVFDHDWGYTSENCLVLNVWTPGID